MWSRPAVIPPLLLAEVLLIIPERRAPVKLVAPSAGMAVLKPGRSGLRATSSLLCGRGKVIIGSISWRLLFFGRGIFLAGRSFGTGPFAFAI
jgi:hypothetical protein